MPQNDEILIREVPLKSYHSATPVYRCICSSLVYQSIECSTGWLRDLGEKSVLNLLNALVWVLAEVVVLIGALCDTPESGGDSCCLPTCFYDLGCIWMFRVNNYVGPAFKEPWQIRRSRPYFSTMNPVMKLLSVCSDDSAAAAASCLLRLASSHNSVPNAMNFSPLPCDGRLTFEKYIKESSV